ncbi:Fc.00g097840.m01.CDS01 [Cosmosporella sp. VM-42]
MTRFAIKISYLVAFAFSSVLATSRPPKVDTHAHFVPDFYAEALRNAGHLPGPDGMPGIPEWSPEDHLKFMDEQNIAKAYLSISSPGVYLNVPSVEATAAAVDLARRTNQYASQVKGKYPDRFGFFASVPLPDVNAALAEIDYCFTQLNPKPDGVVFMSNFYGMYFGDPAMDPIYKKLDTLSAVIFEHPTTPCTEFNALQYHTNTSAPNITQHEWQVLNRPIASRQHPAPTLDFPFDSARTFADLIVTEIPKRFPHLKWIIPHGGGALVSTLDRILLTLPLYTTINMTATDLKETLAKSFYFDLAGPWPVTAAIPPLLRWVEYTRLLWGSDTPWTKWAGAADTAVAFDKDVEMVFKGRGWRNKAQCVRQGNAEYLFSDVAGSP